ncbi:tRNA lysidine(34) synthetase TilS [Cellulomonas sp. ATA003]|uniref:tRNA lysidine(34) synthetase TilS n=1 Tax=Cellulomonas sp. ATA003 TaxID=3073064 RepID=UPI002873C97D|nr:tRNA lysidine(34) synthetase TilS [Cellulomonas sp. ATA003]WNB85307.1 tRNA lysidine(34) synthetase TilS [Cellulomonas sp. ATA003]
MSGPAPAVAAARRAVRDALTDLDAGDLVLVACSGGPDSLALAVATAFVAPRAGLRAGAVVVDHGLQAGSAHVADDAAAACRALGLTPVEVVRVTVGAAGGPEAAARDARYAALDAASRRHGAAAVLLGHTLDDQAETVLLGLARGSGARSLAGMPARRGALRRPLLGLRRADTVAVCAAAGVRPWDDPTNTPTPTPTDDPTDGTAPLRSRVRHRVLPVLEEVLGPGVAEALARTADGLREDADALDALAADLLARARTPEGHLDVVVLGGAAAAVRRRALRAAAVAAGSPAGALRREHVLGLDSLLVDWHGQGPLHLPGGLLGSRVCGRLRLHTPTPEEHQRWTLRTWATTSSGSC